MSKHDDCSSCPIFEYQEQVEEHLRLMNSVRPNITSNLIRREDGDTNAHPAAAGDEQVDKLRRPEKIKCDHCEKRSTPSGMVKHKKNKHSEHVELKCTICADKFQTKNTLDKHYSKKHIVNTIAFLECRSCDYKTMNKFYMTDHVKRQHQGDGFNSFVCSQCYVRKPNEYLLKKHQQQHVTSVCVVCEKKFNSAKNLKRHTTIHEIQRCEECGKNFQSKKELKLHKVSHKSKHVEVDALS